MAVLMEKKMAERKAGPRVGDWVAYLDASWAGDWAERLALQAAALRADYSADLLAVPMVSMLADLTVS